MPSAPSLASLLRRRSRTEVAAFVAALYAARGAETRVEGGSVVVDGSRYLVVPAGYRARVRQWLPGAIRSTPHGATASTPDRVVAVDAARADALAERYDAPVLTPATLDDLARYGLDHEIADAVYRDHLGRSLDDVAPAAARSRSPDAPDRATTDSSAPNRDDVRDPASLSTGAVVATVAVLASVVLLTTAAALGGGPLAGGSDGVPTTTATPAPGVATDEADVANSPRPTPDETEEGSERNETSGLVLAPGLTTHGVVDADALAEAHATTLANRSYTWELTYVEFANGTKVGSATETVAVAAPSVYVSNVSHDGFLTYRGPVDSRPAYADGTKRYQPTATGLENTTIEDDDAGRQQSRARQYYGILLDGQETSVVRTLLGGPRLYVVDIEGTSAVTVQNYTATARISPEGIVYYYSGSYCLASFGRDDVRELCLSITMQYRNVGETTVEPPPWYTERVPKSA
ncbi:hypothetical protein [Salinigranum salinum]|uniref:hypothetical protein n=1 Tax=Salinigranum salinum TaxID=1364937 RepID=UPI001260C07B|nr:hypothetical protein [Salinigranum salinum]